MAFRFFLACDMRAKDMNFLENIIELCQKKTF